MAITVLKTKFEKAKPKEIFYRDINNFYNETFKSLLRERLSTCKSYSKFEEVFIMSLDQCAPLKKKIVRANEVSYMTKTLKKAMMRRSQLENKYYKSKTSADNKLRKNIKIL